MSKRRPLNQDDMREMALAMPDAVEGAHMGHPDFRVRNKIFATLHPDGLTATFKTTPADLVALVMADPETYRAVWGGRYLAVDLRRVQVDALRTIVIEAWRLTAPKTLVTAYRGSLQGDR